MRTTKALVCAAALAAGAITSMAQVYSLNVVGYVNVPLQEGFNMVANQLDADGTGTNNSVSQVFSNTLPLNTLAYKWTGSAWTSVSYAHSGKSTTTPVIWSANLSFNPGEGVFVKIPAGAYAGGTSNTTFVGNVLQGALKNPYLPNTAGFAVLSSMTPISGGVQTGLGYQPQLNEIVYNWSNSAPSVGQWVSASYAHSGKSTTSPIIWAPAEPQIKVGQGLFLKAQAGSSWSNYFIVQ